VLVETVEALLLQVNGLRADANAELLLVDQTSSHDEATESALKHWSEKGVVRWVRLEIASVTGAMNRGLAIARAPVVLFLDDDIEPAPDLVAQHLFCHHGIRRQLIAGRVIQPRERGQPANPTSLFNAPRAGSRREFMGGNFSVDRDFALSIGGFDENFLYSAYRYEREFADRWLAAGGSIRYHPQPWIHHLQAEKGGVRSFGNHLTTAGPGHSQGAYYYILGTSARRYRRVFRRLGGSVCTRHHLRRPWHIPRTILAELRGLGLAILLRRSGRQLLPTPGKTLQSRSSR
jgi:GT2 family glycosyltransferase